MKNTAIQKAAKYAPALTLMTFAGSAFAQEVAATGADANAAGLKAIGAGLALGLGAVGTGLAQAWWPSVPRSSVRWRSGSLFLKRWSSSASSASSCCAGKR
jgi:hypothetical protein